MEEEGNVYILNDSKTDNSITNADICCAECEICNENSCDDDALISETILTTLHSELQGYPKLLLFVKRLQCCIRRQRLSLKKGYGHVTPEPDVPDCHDAATQTEDIPKRRVDISVQCDTSDLVCNAGETCPSQVPGHVFPYTGNTVPDESSWMSSRVNIDVNVQPSLADQVKQAAESAMQQTGFVYEATSGMYYDYNTGYYYNAELGLYYNGNDGTYYSYDGSTNEFKFHSRAEVTYPSSQLCAVATSQQIPAKTKRVKKEKKTKEKKRVKIINEESEEVRTKEDVDVSLEEGECSESSTSDSCSDDDVPSEKEDTPTQDDEVAAAWPPCMRIIVEETGLEKLKVGTLFIVTYTGGTLGREGDHAVVIPDINISKYHARFSFDELQGKYTVTDVGSRNGTYLDGQRLSVAKQESEPCKVEHGSMVQVGCTRLLCHVHSGQETCSSCEPGLVQGTHDSVTSAEGKSSSHCKELQRKSELRKLRRKFGLESSEPDVPAVVKPGYEDRAEIRRKTVGSSSEHEKTQVASLDEIIQSDNKGYKMLAKMGWSQGQSLGKEGQGAAEPVPLSTQQGRAGLGSEAPPPAPESTAAERKKIAWKKTQQRYHKIEGL